MKKNFSINTKIKYTESFNYQKHFTLDDRIKIHKIISENRDDDGAISIILKDIGNMLEKDPSSISKEVKLHRVKKNRPDYFAYKFSNSICEHYSTCNKQSSNLHKFLKCSTKCINSCKDFEENVCPNLKKFPWVCNGCKKDQKCRLNKDFYLLTFRNLTLTLQKTRGCIAPLYKNAYSKHKTQALSFCLSPYD